MQIEGTITKAKLPQKTNIAVWWIRIIAVLVAIGGLIFLFVSLGTAAPVVKEEGAGILLLVVFAIVLPIWLVFFLPSVFLTLKKQWSWTTSIVIISIETLGIIGTCAYFATIDGLYYLQYASAIIILLVPFILLTLDRKNYFEMVRQRDLEKKASENGQSSHKDD